MPWRLLRTTKARVCAGRGRGIVFSKDFSDFHERDPGLIAPVFSLYPAGDMLNLERHMRRLRDANYAPDAPLRSSRHRRTDHTCRDGCGSYLGDISLPLSPIMAVLEVSVRSFARPTR